MTRVDDIYIQSLKDIQTNGYNEKDAKNGFVRPVWEDGVPAYTIYLPQYLVRYERGETPITNLRNIAWKSGIKEILWIYQDKSPDVNMLKEKYGVNYWDEWADENGSLGTAYGYQIAKEFTSPETGQTTNQIDRLLYNIKNQPLNRRHMMNMIHMEDMKDMGLIPCAFMTLWTVVEDRINLTLVQRSGDFMAAASPGGINSLQYYALLLMVCRDTGYKPGEFVHFVQNLHIYDRHMAIADQVLTKKADYPTPHLRLKEGPQSFYDITIDDFYMENYEPDDTKYNIPIAL